MKTQFKLPKDPVTKLCALVPVIFSIYLTNRGLASLHIGVELVIGATALFGALSYLLSQAITRLSRVKHDWVMISQVSVLAIGFMLVEAFFAHLGLKWFLVDQAKLGTLAELDPLLWFFSAALAVTNVFTKHAFLGRAKPRKRKDTPKVKGQPQLRSVG